MALEPGTHVGPYEVVSKLGEGGMGAVYRAHDPRLRRDVAIKVLPQLVAADTERLSRFEREGQALAALNHQHIAHIYGVESLDGTPCLVMELVEGPTLADRIAHGRVPMREAVQYAEQIAQALDAAHEKGIIHRDLKPANIKVTPDGDVKVLDFGLAKIAEGTELGGGPDRTSTENSPTLTARATKLGLILGTGAYMSPEQARGKIVDKRADIWAFGCVLFELVTGKRAFEGEDITDVIARVIEREPDWTRLPHDIPPAVRKLLGRCLTKDPKARLRDIGEARHMLAEISGASPISEPVPIPTAALSTSSTRPRATGAQWKVLPWAIALAAVIVVIVMAMQPSPALGVSAPRRFELVLPPDVEIFGVPSLSENGQTIAFIGVREGLRQVWVRQLGQSEAKPIPGTDGASTVAASADGRTGALIGTDTRVKRLSFETNLIETVLRGADINRGIGIARDGTLVFTRGAELVALPPGATEPRKLTSLIASAGELALSMPKVTASGEHVVFSLRSTAGGQVRNQLVMIPLAGGERRIITDGERVLATLMDRIVFSRDNALLISGFDERAGTLIGQTTRMPEDVSVSVTGFLSADVSHDGSIVIVPSKLASSKLVWVDANGKETVLPGPARIYQNPRVAPTGALVAFAANGTIWTQEPSRGALTRVSPDTGDPSAGFPVWHTDGRRLFYRTRDGMVEKRADGEGSGKQIKDTGVADYPSSVTPDGKTLIFLHISAEAAGDVMEMAIETGEIKPIIATNAYEGAPQISPNGNWLTYVSNDSGNMEVYLRPFRGEDRRWPVSSGGGLHPLWDPNGKTIYYRAGQKLYAVDVTFSPEVRMAPARQVFERQYEFGVNLTIANYSISRDSRQFLFVKREPGNNFLTFVTNWVK